jgi:phosphoserine phosphatase RsbU/P
VVTDSIIIRDGRGSEKKSDIIGKVIDRGLAGWVAKHLKEGIMLDARKYRRWLTFLKELYKVRSALSLPIVKHKSLFGILTLIHPEPGYFDWKSSQIMQVTADQMALAIENAQLYIDLEEHFRLHQEVIQKDLLLAKEVQESFLPTDVPLIKGFEFGELNRPALEVGGDFYNFFRLSDNKLGIVIEDVSGKGIAAALFMDCLTSDLQFYSHLYRKPSDRLEKISTILCERAEHGMFVTLVYMLLEIDKNRICFSNAGHLPSIYMDNNGIKILGKDASKGPPLEILPETKFKQEWFNIKKNGSITLYTDGIIEAKKNLKNFTAWKAW